MLAEPNDFEYAPPLEISNPDAPGEIVRIGPSLTQVAGFGPTGVVASWISRALPLPSFVITADAYDEAHAIATANFDPAAEIEAELDRLEARAEWLEHRINAIDNGDLDSEPDPARAAAALGLALEFEALADGEEANSTVIQLRAKAAQVLGRLPGQAPNEELRSFAHLCMREGAGGSVVIDPDERDSLVEELEAIDAQGQTLADQLEHPTAGAGPSPSVVLDVVFGTPTSVYVVDGDLLYACTYDVREELLGRMHDVARTRRVVLVSDDTILDAFVDSVPRGMLWSSGHLHLVHRETDVVWDDDPEVRGATLLSLTPTTAVDVCVNHPGSATRLHCPTCGQPFCSLCLIEVDKRAVECVACALGRGGVRPRRWRS